MGVNIAIIPARAGSRRLPHKNIKKFLGRPIIQYTVEEALESHLFDVVVVSSESDEILRCVEGMGCAIHKRRQELATDTARVVDVLKDVLFSYQVKGYEFEYMCCLYPTAPLRDRDDMASAFQLMKAAGADYCLAVTEYDMSPFFAFDVVDGNKLKRRWPELSKLPPWQKPKVVVDNGSMYWARVSAFMASGELEGENTVGYLMPHDRSVDIDTEEDFRLAEFYAQSSVRFPKP